MFQKISWAAARSSSSIRLQISSSHNGPRAARTRGRKPARVMAKRLMEKKESRFCNIVKLMCLDLALEIVPAKPGGRLRHCILRGLV